LSLSTALMVALALLGLCIGNVDRFPTAVYSVLFRALAPSTMLTASVVIVILTWLAFPWGMRTYVGGASVSRDINTWGFLEWRLFSTGVVGALVVFALAVIVLQVVWLVLSSVFRCLVLVFRCPGKCARGVCPERRVVVRPDPECPELCPDESVAGHAVETGFTVGGALVEGMEILA